VVKSLVSGVVPFVFLISIILTALSLTACSANHQWANNHEVPRDAYGDPIL